VSVGDGVSSNELYGTIPNVIAFLSLAEPFNISTGKKKLEAEAGTIQKLACI
jgi:hypothetical protein